MKSLDIKVIGEGKQELVDGLEIVLQSLKRIPFERFNNDIAEFESKDGKKVGYEYQLDTWVYADIYRNETSSKVI